jgi:hypothetical protein
VLRTNRAATPHPGRQAGTHGHRPAGGSAPGGVGRRHLRSAGLTWERRRPRSSRPRWAPTAVTVAAAEHVTSLHRSLAGTDGEPSLALPPQTAVQQGSLAETGAARPLSIADGRERDERETGLCDLSYTPRRPRSSMNTMMTAKITTTVPTPMYMVRSLCVCGLIATRRSRPSTGTRPIRGCRPTTLQVLNFTTTGLPEAASAARLCPACAATS